MKKLLALLSATGFIATSATSVIACTPSITNDNSDNNDNNSPDVPNVNEDEFVFTIDKSINSKTRTIKLTYIEGAAFEFISDKGDLSAITIKNTEVSSENQTTTITFEVTPYSSEDEKEIYEKERLENIVEKITIKYNNAEVGVYNITIEKIERVDVYHYMDNNFRDAHELDAGEMSWEVFNEAMSNYDFVFWESFEIVLPKEGTLELEAGYITLLYQFKKGYREASFKYKDERYLETMYYAPEL